MCQQYARRALKQGPRRLLRPLRADLVSSLRNLRISVMNYSPTNDQVPQHDVISVDTEDGVTRAYIFALPVVQLDDGGGQVLGRMEGVEDLAQLLHSLGGMGGAEQGIFVLPHLVSPIVLANLIKLVEPSVLAGMMVADCERVALGMKPQIDRYFSLSADSDVPMPVRFVLGCCYRIDGESLQLISREEWFCRGIGQAAESTLALAAPQSGPGLVRAVEAPAIGCPLPLQDSLVEGLLLVVKRAADQWGLSAPPEVVHTRSGSVEMRLRTGRKALQFDLSPHVIGEAVLEAVLAGLNPVLAERGQSTCWAHSGRAS